MSTSKKPKDGYKEGVPRSKPKFEEFKNGGRKDPSGRIAKGRFDLIPPTSLRRLAQLYARGAGKYDDRNWEKGIPFSVCIDSLLRHANQYKEGERDEDHLAAIAFWAFAMMHFEEQNMIHLQDLPDYIYMS